MRVIVGGHRGSGCTDSPHAVAIGQDKPAENTLESIQRALDNGAQLIEIDVIQTADDKLVVIHSGTLNKHVISDHDLGLVGDHTYESLQNLRTGINKDGRIPLLSEVLELCKDVTVNIEVKDVKGTDAPKFIEGRPALVDLLAEEVDEHPGDLILSSFSIWDLEALKERMPHIPRAMLFESITKDERSIYPDGCEDASTYMYFSVEHVLEVLRRADVQYVHPCIDNIHEEVVALCAQYNLKMNTWALHETLPEASKAFVTNAVGLCKEHGVSLGIITDFVPEMIELIPQLNVSIEAVRRLTGLDEGPSL